MAELVSECPRCGATKITFDLTAANYFQTMYGWQRWHEGFGVCRLCGRATIFVLSQRDPKDERAIERGIANLTPSINLFMNVEGFVNIKDVATVPPPEHLPEDIAAPFKEGATAFAVGIYNAAATMFRLCVDLATRPKLPADDVPEPNARTRRNLGLRLPWLFDNGILPGDLRELSLCIKEDGNDGAHIGSLTKPDAEDLLDFTVAMLERIYTEPERLALAEKRRKERRATPRAT